jgi:Domain of unknown function (DUF1844)
VADPKHEDTSFKVIDRRLFSENGEIRPEVVEQERRDDEAAARKAAAATQAQPAPQASSAGSAQPKSFARPSIIDGAQASAGSGQQSFDSQSLANGTANDLIPEAPGDEISGSSRSFQMLVDFLTRNAAAMLGGMADPRTGQAFVDLEGAREVIDMLDALREKTRGNLSTEDNNLLIEVLGSLKLTFMEISKAAAEQMAKKAKAK